MRSITTMARNEAAEALNPKLGGFAHQRLWEALVISGFLLLCGFDLLHHAMWRDEMQPWLFARDSGSIAELFRNMRYEMHPRLWYLILFGAARLTGNPAAVQVLNFVIIGSAIALFVLCCPLPFWLRALATFGYFFVYQWGTISRNYALGVLFCFLFCARLGKRERNWLELAGILFLAIESNLCAAVLAAGLCWYLVLEAWTIPEARARLLSRKWEAAAGALLVVVGMALAAWTAVPQPGSDAMKNYFHSTAASGDRVISAFATVWDGFVPVPWTIGILPLGRSALHAIMGMIFFPLTVVFFWRWRLIFWTYLGGVLLFLIFAILNMRNFPRHAGHLLLWFLICLWLACYSPSMRPKIKMSVEQRFFVGALLLFQVFDTGLLSFEGFENTFSCSEEVAAYIERHDMKGLPVAGYPDYAVMPVSGYLDKRIYYLDEGRWGSYIIEDNKPPPWTQDEVLRAVREFAARGNHDFLLLLNRPLVGMGSGGPFQLTTIDGLREEASFSPAIVDDEVYWLYRYKG